MTSKQLPENTTLYIATDEKQKSFFDDLKEHYHIVFLGDFEEELGHINSNFFGTFVAPPTRTRRKTRLALGRYGMKL